MRVVTHTLVGLTLTVTIVPICNHSTKQRLTRWWCARLLKCFNIQVTTYGQTPGRCVSGKLFVANHISWVDIHALNSVLPLCFVAKSEIKQWPVLGYLASKSGTLFIDRSHRKGAVHIIEILRQHLQHGFNACYFPEGTTTEGTHVLPFKGSIMQAALSIHAEIVPVAIRYPLAHQKIDTRLAYAGNTTLIESIRNILRIPSPSVELHFLDTIETKNQSRRNVNKLAEQAINEHLGFS